MKKLYTSRKIFLKRFLVFLHEQKGTRLFCAIRKDNVWGTLQIFHGDDIPTLFYNPR